MNVQKKNIINNILLMIFLLIALCLCKQKNEIVTLPMDKLYILEYRYILPEEQEEPYYKFYVGGFCELDKGFNVKYARRFIYNSNDFYNSTDIIPDSLRSEISNILLKYQTDTTFLYQGASSRVYNGNIYRFIIQKYNQKDVTIKFEPKFLPDDLKFVYLYLYEDRQRTEDKGAYNELLEMFEMFENQVKDDSLEFPPPILKSTIKFTPPHISIRSPLCVEKIIN